GVGTSRAHVELSREGGEYVLKDLGSRNGTILKGESMVPYKEYPLKEGDTFVIAGLVVYLV
ncbi:pSer/pThr/pTyr-binding forkhead associated (FHA) protein, partial [Paenibacillus sp. LBL]